MPQTKQQQPTRTQTRTHAHTHTDKQANRQTQTYIYTHAHTYFYYFYTNFSEDECTRGWLDDIVDDSRTAAARDEGPASCPRRGLVGCLR